MPQNNVKKQSKNKFDLTYKSEQVAGIIYFFISIVKHFQLLQLYIAFIPQTTKLTYKAQQSVRSLPK